MFKMGIIEESLETQKPLIALQPFFYSQRIEEVPEDVSPIWHTNEYHVPEDKMIEILPLLERHIKPTWYIHAFNDEKLIVVLSRKSFHISLHKDETWNDMIAYGESADVEKHYLENIPLHI